LWFPLVSTNFARWASHVVERVGARFIATHAKAVASRARDQGSLGMLHPFGRARTTSVTEGGEQDA
jgi:hypothetical protein